MAWRSSGTSNEGLITNLSRNGLIESARVKEAMLKARPTPLEWPCRHVAHTTWTNR